MVWPKLCHHVLMPLSDEMFEYDRFTKPFSVSAMVIYYTEIFHLWILKQASDQYVFLRHFSSCTAKNVLKQQEWTPTLFFQIQIWKNHQICVRTCRTFSRFDGLSFYFSIRYRSDINITSLWDWRLCFICGEMCSLSLTAHFLYWK